MGSNLVNLICEKSTRDILRVTGGIGGIRVISNFCTERYTKASFAIPIDEIGIDVARKIV